jgi:hypothetical protein
VPVPPSSGTDALDMSRVVIERDADIRQWPVTSRMIDAHHAPDGNLTTDHSLRGKWPAILWAFSDTTKIEGNQWVFVQLDGVWYGTAAEWLRPNQAVKNYTGTYWEDGAGRALDWRPRRGEQVGVCVSTPARHHHRHVTPERSNVVLVTWQRDWTEDA